METTETERASLPASLGSANRYKVIEGSQSGHCCFDYTVVDTDRPCHIHGKQYNGQFEALCECIDEADAKAICDALNAYSPNGILRLASNWRKAVAAHKQLRAEFWRDGELSLWMTSWMCAPVAWGLCGAFALYYAIKDESESQNEKMSHYSETNL